MAEFLFDESTFNTIVLYLVHMMNALSLQPMNKKVRVRFAPSPPVVCTLGGVRTVLYNYLICQTTTVVILYSALKTLTKPAMLPVQKNIFSIA